MLIDIFEKKSNLIGFVFGLVVKVVIYFTRHHSAPISEIMIH